MTCCLILKVLFSFFSIKSSVYQITSIKIKQNGFSEVTIFYIFSMY